MRYFLQRFAQLVVVFVLVTFGVLVLMRIGSGGPRELANRMLGGFPSEKEAADTILQYHLDSNYFTQYLYWLRDLFIHQDLGYSKGNSSTVAALLGPRVWTTVLLGLYANVFALLLAVPVAVRQAYKRDGAFDRVSSLFTFAIVGVPAIVLGVFLRLLLVVRFKVFLPLGTKVYPWQDLGQHFHAFFLPTLTLTLPLAAVYARLLRADMIMTLQADFVTLASAKGVSPSRVLWHHALRNSAFSLLTAVGTQLGALVGSALVVETLFAMDGLGAQLVRSVGTRDLFTVQSLVAIIVLFVVTVNLLVDLLYTVIDPRIRHARVLK
jgi:peptide/nickel transport system permease protein